MTTKQRELLSKRNMTPDELRAAARKLNITSRYAFWLRQRCITETESQSILPVPQGEQ